MVTLLLAWTALAAWPLTGTDAPDTVQDVFGPRILEGDYDLHRGIDLAGQAGDPVHAVADGTVVRVETEAETDGTALERNGTWVLIEHAPFSSGLPAHSAYLHLASLDVRVGDEVVAGSRIGTVGSTGVGIQTEHLHLHAYEGLVGTAIDRHASVSPHRVMDVAPTGRPFGKILADGTLVAAVRTPDNDLVRVELETRDGEVVIDFETGQGLCEDDPTCHGVTIEPFDYGATDRWAVWAFTLDQPVLRAYLTDSADVGRCLGTGRRPCERP